MEEESITFSAYDKSKFVFNVQFKKRILTTPRMQYTDHQWKSFKSHGLVEAIQETPNTAELFEKGDRLPRFNINNLKNKTGKFSPEQKVLVKFDTQQELETATRNGFIWLYK